LRAISGCIAVSPRLLSQVPATIPKLLLRGVIGDDVVAAAQENRNRKAKIILFSGTHIHSNGVEELLAAWPKAGLPDWELHITGYGQLTERLRQVSSNIAGVVFHGLLDRPELVRLMSSAAICVNPHQVSRTPGNVFAFKLTEYLAAGAHVITPPMGPLERELEAGITYMPDNSPETIAATIRQVVNEECYQSSASEAAHAIYGSAAVSTGLEMLLAQVREARASKTVLNAQVRVPDQTRSAGAAESM
jgi:glycosyltransferase involved in cell wall biosynthesis